MNKNRLTIKIALSIVSILMASTVSASDQALLDILFKNGVLNQAQYEKLSRQSEEKEQEEIARTTSMSPTMAKAMDWASRVKISGDMRLFTLTPYPYAF